MTGKWLLKRIGMTLLLSAGLFILLASVDADAAPIRPDIRKLVKESQATPPQLGPARAGWDGPEIRRNDGRTNPALDPTATLRSNKAALITAAIPDSRAVMAVIVIIFLMRMLRNEQEKKQQRAVARVVPFDAQKERIAA